MRAAWGHLGRLWSLWDMLRGYAWKFFLLSRFIEDVRQKLDMPPIAQNQNPNILASYYLATPEQKSGLGDLSLQQAVSGDYIEKKECDDITRVLQLLKTCCEEVGLVAIGSQFERVISYVGSAPKKSKTQFHIEELGARIVDELSDVQFFHVPANKAKYYGNPAWAFDSPIKGLDLIAEDITRAGNCYVFGENTASVFHLMRVMEHCVQAFGKKLKVITINVKADTWHQIMLHVHSQIVKLPGGKNATAAQNTRKQKFSLAASRLDHVRIAWRNDVMHPKATYDESEALEVMNSVKAFLSSISELI